MKDLKNSGKSLLLGIIFLLFGCTPHANTVPLEPQNAIIAGLGRNWLVIENSNLTAWGEDYGRTPDTEENYWSAYSDREIIFENAASVWGSRFTALVLDNEGRLWTSGASGHESPETIGDWELVLSDVVTASYGLWNGAAVCSDGSLWVWGRNDRGQLCNGKIDKKGNFYPPNHIMDGVASTRHGQYIITLKGELYGLDLLDGQTEPILLETGVKDMIGDQLLREDGSLCSITFHMEGDSFSCEVTPLGISGVDEVFLRGYRTEDGMFYLWDYSTGNLLAESPKFLIEEKIVECTSNAETLLLTQDGRLLQADVRLGKVSLREVT